MRTRRDYCAGVASRRRRRSRAGCGAAIHHHLAGRAGPLALACWAGLRPARRPPRDARRCRGVLRAWAAVGRGHRGRGPGRP
eukprot:11751214-Alexandrium_andersonii.AAC.1